MYQFIEKAVSDCVAWLAGLDFYCSYNLEHLFSHGEACNILAYIVLSHFCFNFNLSFLYPGSPFLLHLNYYIVLSLTDLWPFW